MVIRLFGLTVIGALGLGCLLFFTREPVAVHLEPTKFWADMIQERGPDAAYRHLVEGVAHLPDLEQHLTAHRFGEALYEVEGLHGVAVCEHHYGQGCFHQYFMAALFDQGESVVRAFSDACGDKLEQRDNIRACNHGLGHGVMVAFEERGVAGALDACSTIDNQQAFFGCIDGVFMEYFTPTHTGRDAAELPVRTYNPTDPYAPCDTLTDSFKPSCYYMQSSWWVFKKVPYQDAAELCRTMPDAYTETCLVSLGHVIAIASEFDKETSLTKCNEIAKDESEQLACRAGAHWAFSRAGEVGVQLSLEEQSLCDFSTASTSAKCLALSDMTHAQIGISVICCDTKV